LAGLSIHPSVIMLCRFLYTAMAPIGGDTGRVFQDTYALWSTGQIAAPRLECERGDAGAFSERTVGIAEIRVEQGAADGPRDNVVSPTLLLIAVSARALATAARRARYAAIAIDAFGDEDTRAACVEVWKVEGAMGGFAGIALEPVVAQLCAAYAPQGIVFGSGFDDCPRALVALARHAPLLGRATALRRAKDPRVFANACGAVGIAHPEIRTIEPETPSQWLVKRRGGSGGLHVAAAQKGRPLRHGEYWQRKVNGRTISLLFVRDALAAAPIAWSEQWTAPSESAPYRYGGAAGPIEDASPRGFFDKLAALTLRLGVRGLASADFVDDGERLWLLEINPRPGATLAVFDTDDDPLLTRHIDALSNGQSTPPKPRNPKASAIVYAESDTEAPRGDWPDWASDRPSPGSLIPAGAPICTVSAAGATAADARAETAVRSRRIQAWLREAAL
jgi:predicted ATP-grasp superfamily ATP-dependent carboligase